MLLLDVMTGRHYMEVRCLVICNVFADSIVFKQEIYFSFLRMVRVELGVKNCSFFVDVINGWPLVIIEFLWLDIHVFINQLEKKITEHMTKNNYTNFIKFLEITSISKQKIQKPQENETQVFQKNMYEMQTYI